MLKLHHLAIFSGHFIYFLSHTQKTTTYCAVYDVKCFHKEGCRISLMHYLSLLIRITVLYLPTDFVFACVSLFLVYNV